MELRQIREFLAVLECGSIGDAARRLNISQPNLTREIKLLEHSVGGALFIRSSRGVQPTPLARAFEPRARVIAGEVNRAERELDAYRGAQRGKIVIGTGPVSAYAILPSALTRFRQAHSAVEVRVSEGQVRENVQQILSGEMDLAFHAAEGWDATEDLSTEIILRHEPVVIVARADHPLVRCRQPSLKEVAAAHWILPTGHTRTRERFDRFFREQGVVPPVPAVELDSAVLTPYYLYHGDCLSLIAQHLVGDDLRDGRLKRVPVPGLNWHYDIKAIRRRDVPLPPAAELLLSEVRQVGAELRRRPHRA